MKIRIPALAFLVVLALSIGQAEAWWNASYTVRYNITPVNNDASFFVANDSFGMNGANGIQYIWCNQSSTYLYYHTTDENFMCGTLSSQMPTVVAEGNGSSYGDLEPSLNIFMDLNDTKDNSRYGLVPINSGATQTIGNVGHAMDFDGTGDVINTTLQIGGWSEMTIAAWIYPRNISKLFDHIITDWSGTEAVLIRSEGSAQNFHYGLRTTIGGKQESQGSITIHNDTWNFVVLTFNGTIGQAYVNMTPDTTITANGTIDNSINTIRLGSDGTNHFNGSIDEFMVWNRTLSVDELTAIFNNTVPDGYSVASAAEAFNNLTINNPRNITYPNTTIPINFEYPDCDDASYSLNGAANVTIGCVNTSSFTSIIGQNEFILYVNDTSGTNASDTVYFTSSYATYDVSVFDEMTGLAFNTSDMTLTAFCENDTETTDFGASTLASYSITCTLEEIKLTITDDDNNTHWRTLIPATTFGSLNFFMINETSHTAVAQSWQIYDITALYDDGIVRVNKVIPDRGVQTIIQKVIDAEFKVKLFIIETEKYRISIFDTNLENERNMGTLEATTAASVNLEVSSVPYDPELRAVFRDVFITFDQNATTQIIRATYNDTLDETTLVEFTVINASNTTQTMFSDSSTSSVVTFTYNGVDVNTTYIARIEATHTRYGDIEEEAMITFSDTGKFDIRNLNTYNLEIWEAIAAGMLVMFVMLGFGRNQASLGAATGALMMVMFMYFGWFSAVPQMGWGMITVVAFIGFLSVIGKRRSSP